MQDSGTPEFQPDSLRRGLLAMTKKIRKLREGRWPNDLWYRWLWSKQVYRAIVTGKQGAAELVFGVFSLIITLILYFLSSGAAFYARSWLIVGASATLILSAILAGIWALATMSPSIYAQTTLGGRTASETLQLISLDIRDACNEFRKDAKVFLQDSHPPIEVLKKRFARSHSKLLRITALMGLASEQLDIPLHRLRELLLEYDPAMHRAHAREFIQNLELLSSGATLNPEHMEAVKVGNENSIARARARTRAQTDILEYTALHSSVLRMAAVHSTAQATQEYARIVSHVARLASDELLLVKSWDPDERQLLDDAMCALRFLACRQRTHSGFDLNGTCLSMTRIEAQKKRTPADPNRQQKLDDQLTALSELGRSIDRWGDGLFVRDPKDESKFLDQDRRHVVKVMADLRDLWPYTVKKIEEDRSEIVTRFSKMYESWVKRHAAIPKTLLVTHGFSTTVREVLKRGIPDRKAGIPASGQDLPDVFVIGSGNPSDLDSRLMVSALLEVPTLARRFGRLASGDKMTLSKLLEDDVKVMVILGAEGFDTKGRVLHPWGLASIGWLKKKLGSGSAFCTVVVAEGYKFHEDLLSNPQDFRYHLDRVHLYDPQLLDVILTTDIESVEYDMRTPNTCTHPTPTARMIDRRGSNRDKHILRHPVAFNHLTHEKAVFPTFDLKI
jgi:hypothetical protein